MNGFRPTGTMTGEDGPTTGDDRVIRTTNRYGMSFEVTLVDVNPALPWLLGRIVNPTLLHDACWDGEVIR